MKQKRKRKRSRSGVALVAALVCMGVAMVILFGLIESSVRQRRQSRIELQVEQTRWLLDAAVRHAVNRADREPDYQGETIQFSLDGKRSVELAITTNELSDRWAVVATLTNKDLHPQTTKRSAAFSVTANEARQPE